MRFNSKNNSIVVIYAHRRFYKIGHCGQSYKQFTIVIYDSRVVIWGNFKSNTTLES